jgi:hypothetical protein
MKNEINSFSFDRIDKVVSDLDKVSRQLRTADHVGALDQYHETEEMIGHLARLKGRKDTVLKNIDLNLTKLEAVKKTASDLFLV